MYGGIEMKTIKSCPKCQSDDVLRVPGTQQTHGFGNNIKAGATMFSAILVTKYLCCNCGYIEDWVDDPQDIVKIKKYYTNRTK